MALIWACSPFIEPEDMLNADCACLFDDGDGVQAWIDMASDVLCHLSAGWMTGLCERTVRPVARLTEHGGCLPDTIGPWGPDPWSTSPWSLGPYQWGPPLILRGPSTNVTQVKVDGVVLDPSEYVLVDDNRLVRTSGHWPTHNDVRLADTEAGTWSVSLSWGQVDLITRQAAIEMTCELAKADGVGESLVFAPGVVAANVQGASVAIEDIAQAVMEGRELLPKTARFISVHGGRGDVGGIFTPETEGYRLVEVRTFA